MQMNRGAPDARSPRPAPSREFNKYLFLNNIFIGLGLLLCAWGAAAQAQVARVLDSQGTTIVERSGQLPRLLGRGETLTERDVVSVARDSWAILEFNDQTRITLRPNTVFRLDAYRDDAPESMLLGLTKGGLRVVTGLLGKRNPSGVSIRTATATIGIRGTEFDARLCEADCAAEERAKPAPRPAVTPVARVVEMSGVVGAGRAGEQVRLLVPGAMLNEGDAVAVGRGGSVLLVFSDGARVALVENSRFAINRFRYNEARPGEGSAFLTLYDGNALVATGQLAKIRPDAFLFRTALGVIRPFGTTFSGGGCIGNFCASGSVTVNSDGASASGSASAGGASTSGSTSANKTGVSGSASGTDGTQTRTIAGSAGGTPGGTPPGADAARRFAGNIAGTASEKVAEWVTGAPGNAPASPGQVTLKDIVGTALDVARQGSDRVETKLRGVVGDPVVDTVIGGVEFINRTRSPQDAWTAVSDSVRGATGLAVEQAVNALNSATAPIINEMTALLTQMRNNPPSGEAAAREMVAMAEQLSQRMSAVMSNALAGAEALADSHSFKVAYGLLELSRLEYLALTGQSLLTSTDIATKMVGVSFSESFFSQLTAVRNQPFMASSFDAIGISNTDLDRALFWEPPSTMLDSVATQISPGRLIYARDILETESSQWLESAGSAAVNALFAEARAVSDAARQRSEQEVAAARAAADASKTAAAAKLAAARKAVEENIAADKQLAEQKIAAARAAAEAVKRAAEAKLKDAANSMRAYDITGGMISVVGPPDFVLTPGMLQTLPGEPTVARDGDRVITTWVEPVVNVVRTAQGGNSVAGSVTRTEITGPEGTTTILAFNITFANPMFTGMVPHVGGPLISLGPDKPGTVQITHRAPDGKTTVSYPGNADNKPASVAVTEGEVEIVGRGRVRAGEMLASTGSPVRVPGLTTLPPIKAADNTFGGTDKAVEEGLYVWVRDGAVRVSKDADSVDVAAGNAAVVTDRVRLLDVVPSFMRFDGTPRPLPSGSGSVFDTFRAADGAILNMCSIK